MVLKSSSIDNSCAWLAGLEQVQRYVAGAVIRDQRLHGPFPYKLGPDDIVQEVFVDLIEGEGRTALTPIRIRGREIGRNFRRPVPPTKFEDPDRLAGPVVLG